MIDKSVEAGADAVKFQKRDIDIVYSKEQLKNQEQALLDLQRESKRRG